MTVVRPALAGILILALFVVPHTVEAQPARVYRVGVVLQGGQYSPAVDGLREGLRELGLEEGKQRASEGDDPKSPPGGDVL